MAAIHLGDEGDGVEHRRWVRRFLPGKEVLLLRLAARPLGWLVAKGNPRVFPERRICPAAGSGSSTGRRGRGRAFFWTVSCGKTGSIPPLSTGTTGKCFPLGGGRRRGGGIGGRRTGNAGAGEEVGLDFLPLRDDPFDLVIPLEVAESEAGRLLIELVRSDAFRAAAASLEKGGLERPATDTENKAASKRGGRKDGADGTWKN